jgi:hypothetical protein
LLAALLKIIFSILNGGDDEASKAKRDLFWKEFSTVILISIYLNLHHIGLFREDEKKKKWS